MNAIQSDSKFTDQQLSRLPLRCSSEIFLKEKHMNDHSEYSDYELLIRKARLERSAALGNAIAGLIIGIGSGLRRGINALKSGAGRSKARARAQANTTPDIPAHR